MTRILLLCLAVALGGCASLDYDLSAVPVPVSAKPAPDGDGEPFRLEGKSVLWLHGLAGHSQPDVAALVAAASAGHGAITDFRVRQSASFHDWLITHLTLTLVRMKTVVVEGRLVD